MAANAQTDLVQVSPYVAAAIIEHAKRRVVAAGYILGTRTVEEIIVTDFIPMTHSAPYNDVSSKVYAAERNRRVENAKSFTTNQVLIGWYSAGSCPAAYSAEQFRAWCELPSYSFAGNVARQAIHVHCALPDETSKTMAIQWSAFLTRNSLSRSGEGSTAKHTSVCERLSELTVEVSVAQNSAASVVLSHVASLATGRERPVEHPCPAMNLDNIIFNCKEKSKAPTEALVAIHHKLQDALKQAREGLHNTNVSAEQRQGYAEIVAAVDNMTALKEEALAQQQNPSAREDFNAQRLKDAMMIKCMAALLRKEISQIELLAMQYTDNDRKPAEPSPASRFALRDRNDN